VAAVTAQSSTPYTDWATGIAFQSYQSARDGFAFGIAVPESPTDEFIGQLVSPITGWAGVSFGGGMLDNLLLTAWSNNGEIVRAFRMAESYALPTAYTSTTPELTALTCGTSVNETHFTLTFTCKNCQTWTTSSNTTGGFDLTGETAVMGWAYGADAPTDPADPESDITQHTSFGQFGMLLSSARSADYDSWKECAADGDA
ncbi:hypothetical protein BZA05DRAFT_321355, partial [Tricharina praecox]|uniref:uncharacterized protein n=1 Tax=Tricharina praecox TaxID=43433 RepID=UPI00221E3BB9